MKFAVQVQRLRRDFVILEVEGASPRDATAKAIARCKTSEVEFCDGKLPTYQARGIQELAESNPT